MATIDRRGIVVDDSPSSATSSSQPRADLAIKTPVRAATTANITLSGLQTVDAVVLAEDDRVLVKDQTDPTANGIYNASAGAWARATDFDGSSEACEGTIVYVTDGDTSGEEGYRITAPDGPVTPGTSSITFTIIGSGGGGGGGDLTTVRVVTAAGDVTLTTDDDVVVINKTVGAATVVNLPSSPAADKIYTVKDGKGDAATNNITLTPASGTIDGDATGVMAINYQSVDLVWNDTEWNVV